MKKKLQFIIQYTLVAALGVTGLTSCEKMLEEKKYDFIEPTDIPDSDDGVNQWVVGTYSKLLDDMFRWNLFPPALEFDCDYMSGPDWSFGTLGAGNFQNNEYTAAMWEKPYSVIHRANLSLENIDKMQLPSVEVKNNGIGELYFLKAYAYFLLVRSFGEVPIRPGSVNSGVDIHQERKPIAEVYAHIIDLLTKAEDLMYKNTDTGFQPGRASAGAAASLLAKVYLTIGSASLASGNVQVKGGVPFTTQGSDRIFTNPSIITVTKSQVAGYEGFNSAEYFAKARDKALQVINGEYGTYGLLPYDQLWSKASKNKTEHIWTLQAVSGNDKYSVRFAQGYSGMFNPAGRVQQGLWWGMRDHWYKLFESKDYRVEKGVLHRWIREGDDSSWGGGSYYPNNEEWTKKAIGYDDNGTWVAPVAPFNDGANYRTGNTAQFLAFLTKYADVSDNKLDITDASWYFLRYADVLLIYAEAANEAENNGTARALALARLNEVRLRSNATPKSLTGNGSLNTQESFRSAVLEERAMELALEGDRRWDLIRWGIYLPVMNSIGGIDESNVVKARTDRHLLYPIPNSEVNVNKYITTNNPGWN